MQKRDSKRVKLSALITPPKLSPNVLDTSCRLYSASASVFTDIPCTSLAFLSLKYTTSIYFLTCTPKQSIVLLLGQLSIPWCRSVHIVSTKNHILTLAQTKFFFVNAPITQYSARKKLSICGSQQFPSFSLTYGICGQNSLKTTSLAASVQKA